MLEQDFKPCSDDLTLLTLKGHLIAEHLLETILVRLLAIGEVPKNLRLGFSQKLILIEAVTCTGMELIRRLD
jgi:hypothetical protein